MHNTLHLQRNTLMLDTIDNTKSVEKGHKSFDYVAYFRNITVYLSSVLDNA